MVKLKQLFNLLILWWTNDIQIHCQLEAFLLTLHLSCLSLKGMMTRAMEKLPTFSLLALR